MKLGVLGGTFDPVHTEHLLLAVEAANELALDAVLLLPAPNPPHKSGAVTDYSVRKKMLEAFVSDAADVGIKIIIDETELEFYPEPSYAYKTLGRLAEKYAGDELTYVIGSDSLFKFTTWKNPDAVACTMPICVYPRGSAEGVKEECDRLNALYPGARFFPLDAVTAGVSSSLIRFLTETNQYERAEAFLTPSVYAFIRSHGLYGEYSELTERLKSELKPSLYAHSLNTAEWAVEHAWLGGVGFDRAFTAAILHDAAKPYSPMFGLSFYPAGTPMPVCHQYDGAVRAREVYGITDGEVLEAIKFHTTAKENMSETGKLIYLADKLEKGRNYPGIDELRTAASRGLNEGVAAVLRHTVGYLLSRGETPDPLTYKAFEWYNNERRQNGSESIG